MKNVIVSNIISLDGFMAGPLGEIDWFTGMADKEFESCAIDLLGSVDTILFGRVTYDLMASYWPTASPGADDPRIIQAMNSYPKVVFSRTMKKAEWTSTRLVRGDATEEVSRLRTQPGRDMVVYGSGSIVSALAEKELVDEYFIFVAPLLLGHGKPLFSGIRGRKPLRLRETRNFGSGLVLLRYSK